MKGGMPLAGSAHNGAIRLLLWLGIVGWERICVPTEGAGAINNTTYKTP
jgi:hypothetical protein